MIEIDAAHGAVISKPKEAASLIARLVGVMVWYCFEPKELL